MSWSNFRIIESLYDCYKIYGIDQNTVNVYVNKKKKKKLKCICYGRKLEALLMQMLAPFARVNSDTDKAH